MPLGREAVAAVGAYLRAAGRSWSASARSRKLFVNFRGGALTRQGLYKIVQRHAREAGPRGKMSPHTLRHSSPPICWPAAATCARSRRCSATPTSRRPRSTRTSRASSSRRCTSAPIRGQSVADTTARVKTSRARPHPRIGVLLAALVAVAAAGCGNERAEPPNLSALGKAGPTVAFSTAGGDVSCRHPRSWIAVPGEPPAIAQLTSGGAAATVYAYPRDDLGTDPASVQAARERVLESLRRRAPRFPGSATPRSRD